jgi:hypothetical protein
MRVGASDSPTSENRNSISNARPLDVMFAHHSIKLGLSKPKLTSTSGLNRRDRPVRENEWETSRDSRVKATVQDQPVGQTLHEEQESLAQGCPSGSHPGYLFTPLKQFEGFRILRNVEGLTSTPHSSLLSSPATTNQDPPSHSQCLPARDRAAGLP